jgi:pyrroloquinoline quinone biosynthesis protein B
MPHAGCACQRCAAARAGRIPREFAASLAIVDRTNGESWLIDAGPDFREQLFFLDEYRPKTRLAGILITHAHIGHYVGLMHLGREAMNSAGVNVYGTPSMCDFLRRNAPWSQLASAGNIVLHEQEPASTLALSDRCCIEFVPVPHRGEFSDTVAFAIRGPSRSIFYCPDIDSWEKWNVRALPDKYDVSIIDGTFLDDNELPGRTMSEVPHPTVRHTIKLIGVGRNRVFFTHMNHTNPLISSVEARQTLRAQDFDVVDQGQVFTL